MNKGVFSPELVVTASRSGDAESTMRILTSIDMSAIPEGPGFFAGLLSLEKGLHYRDVFRSIREQIADAEEIAPEEDTSLAELDMFRGKINDIIRNNRGEVARLREEGLSPNFSDSILARQLSSNNEAEREEALALISAQSETPSDIDTITSACEETSSSITEGLWHISSATEQLLASNADEGIDNRLNPGALGYIRDTFRMIEDEIQLALDGLTNYGGETDTDGGRGSEA